MGTLEFVTWVACLRVYGKSVKGVSFRFRSLIVFVSEYAKKVQKSGTLVLIRGSKQRISVEESVHPDEEARSIVEEETPSRHLEGVDQEDSASICMEVPSQREQSISIEEEEADTEHQQEQCIGQEEIHIGDSSDDVDINEGTQLHDDIDMEKVLKDWTISLDGDDKMSVALCVHHVLTSHGKLKVQQVNCIAADLIGYGERTVWE